MSKKNEISLSEWKEALSEAYPKDDGKTLTEIAAELGFSRWKVRKLITNSLKDGRVVEGKAIRKDLCGRARVERVYRPKG